MVTGYYYVLPFLYSSINVNIETLKILNMQSTQKENRENGQKKRHYPPLGKCRTLDKDYTTL